MRKLLIFILLVAITLAVACNATNEPPANEAAPPTKKINKTERVPQTAPDPERNQGPDATAHRIAKIAISVPQVNDATAIVFGKYAIVGIDVDATLDRSKVGTIKYTVAEALKEDPIGATSLITSDPDLLQRLREVNEDINKGRPFKGIVEELSDITARIIPQAPGVVPKKEEPPNNKKQQDINQTNDPKNPRKDLYQQK